MSPRSLIEHIAGTIQARLNCQASGNDEWHGKHPADPDELAQAYWDYMEQRDEFFNTQECDVGD